MTFVDEHSKGAELDAAERTLAEAEEKHGRDSAELCEPLDKAGDLYNRAGLCGKAEIFYKRLVDIVSKAACSKSQIDGLKKLAATYRRQGKLDDAEAVYLKVLQTSSEDEEAVRQTAELLCCLAGVYLRKKEFGQAENALTKASQLFNDALGANNTYSHLCALALASVAMQQGKNSEADGHFAYTLQQSGSGDASTEQRSLIELTQQYYTQSRFSEVDAILWQTIYSDDHRLWPDHPASAQLMHDRGELFRAQSRYADAEKAFKRALEIRLQSLGQAHVEVGHTAMSLSAMYLAQGRFADAEPVLKQAMKSRVLAFGVEHPSVAAAIETYVSLLKSTKRQSIAAKLESRARDIRSKLVWQSERAAAAGRPPAT